MKKLFAVLIAALLFVGCTKQASNQLASEKMSYAQISKLIGDENAYKIFDKAGLTEVGTDGVARSAAKKVKANATLAVWSNDLTLSESAGVLTTTLSPNAEWGGVQKFWTVDTTSLQASVCNWNWSWSTAPATQTCNTAGFGNYRSWTSDKVTYDIHVSPFLAIE